MEYYIAFTFSALLIYLFIFVKTIKGQIDDAEEIVRLRNVIRDEADKWVKHHGDNGNGDKAQYWKEFRKRAMTPEHTQ